MTAVLYFIGCMARYRAGAVRTSTIAILDRLGIEYTTLDDSGSESCCGSVLFRTGQVDDFKRAAATNAERINAGGWSTVITSCAGCWRMFTAEYPAWGYPLEPRVLHTSQFLAELLDAGRLRFKPYPKRVTYHDPCHLARHGGVYDAPRRVLRAIPDLEFEELETHHETAQCCGAGAGVRAATPAVAGAIGARRVEEITASGAAVLVSTCPFCEYHLAEALAGTGEQGQDMDQVQVLDLAELVAAVLIEPDNEHTSPNTSPNTSANTTHTTPNTTHTTPDIEPGAASTQTEVAE